MSAEEAATGGHPEPLEAVARALAALHGADWEAMVPEGRQQEQELARQLLALLAVQGYRLVRGSTSQNHR